MGPSSVLTPRWERLRRVPEQMAFWRSPHRFIVLPPGRRSGKSELAKRRIVMRALRGTRFPRPSFFAAAPTRDQAKRIFWDDLKALVPPSAMAGRPSESELVIRLVNTAEIHVVGMDKPQRVEGSPWDGGVLDEYANMKPDAWPAHVRPAMSDRLGWVVFTGVPEGRNHFYDLFRFAQAEMAEKGPDSEWGAYHWVSAAVLPASEVDAARRDLDPLTFQQEYEGSFVSFEGRAYYVFDADIHACHTLPYDPHAPLVLCFDFNVSPGVAVVAQEQELPHGAQGTGVIGEVHIPRNSTTPAVVRRLIADWGAHQGTVLLHGDATGGARGTAQTEGSDWELIVRDMRAHFGDRVQLRTPRSNPSERARVNAVNTRLLDGEGESHMHIDPAKAPNLVRDLDGVRLLSGGSGEIDKKYDARMTHLSDALGYYIAEVYPIDARRAYSRDMEWV